MVRGVSLNFLFFVGFGIGAIAIGQLLPDRIGPGRDLPPPPPERFGTQRQRNQRPRRPQPNRNLDFDVSPPNSRPELTIEGVDDLLELQIVRNFIRENKGAFLHRELPPPPPDFFATQFQRQRPDQIQRRPTLN